MRRFTATFAAALFTTFALADSFSPPLAGMVLCGVAKSVNMNSTADQAISINCGSSNYSINSIQVVNPSTSLTTAAGGVYTAVSKGGVAVVSNTQTYSVLTTNAQNTSGSRASLTLNTGNAQMNASTLYVSLTTAQGAPATADFYVYGFPMP